MNNKVIEVEKHKRDRSKSKKHTKSRGLASNASYNSGCSSSQIYQDCLSHKSLSSTPESSGTTKYKEARDDSSLCSCCQVEVKTQREQCHIKACNKSSRTQKSNHCKSESNKEQL